MAKLVIRALQGNATSLNLSSKRISEVPTSVSKLKNVNVLLLNNNLITTLPVELLSLQHVSPYTLVCSFSFILFCVITALTLLIAYVNKNV